MKRSPEKAFMMEFLKAVFGNGDPAALKDHFKNSSPETLNKRVREQGLAPFFLRHMETAAPGIGMPAGTIGAWKEAAGRIALKNAMLAQEAVPVFEYLNQNGIEYALLKGFSYSGELYGSRWARPSGDIDILIDKRDYPGIKDHLLSRGFNYKIAPGFESDREKWVATQESIRNDMGFWKTAGVFTFYAEIHWDIANLKHEGSPFYNMFRVETDGWLRAPSHFSLGETNVKRLPPEMHFIHTVHHFAYGHQYAGLKWLLDICLFTNAFGQDLDWDAVKRATERRGCRKLFAVACRMAAEIIGEDNPAVVKWREIHPWDFNRADYIYFKSRLFARRSLTGAYVGFMFMPEGLSDKIRMASYILFNSGVSKRWDIGGKTKHPLLQPLYILSWALREKYGGRKSRTSLYRR